MAPAKKERWLPERSKVYHQQALDGEWRKRPTFMWHSVKVIFDHRKTTKQIRKCLEGPPPSWLAQMIKEGNVEFFSPYYNPNHYHRRINEQMHLTTMRDAIKYGDLEE